MPDSNETYITAKHPTFHRQTPSSPDLIRLGILGCAPGMSHVAEIYGPQINPIGGETAVRPFDGSSFIRATGMRMTHVWDPVEKNAEAFARKYDVARVPGFTDMIGRVDAIMLSDIASVPYFYELSKPFLEAGVSLFLNRPFAYSRRALDRLLDLIASCGTPVFYGDEFEHVKEAATVRKAIAAQEPLRGVEATNSMSDYASHGIHGINWVLSCIGGGVKRVSYQTPSYLKPNGVVALEYAPRVEGGKVFYVALQEMMGGLTSASITVYGDKDVIAADLTWGANQWERYHHVFGPVILAFQRMIEEGRMVQSLENLRHRTEVFLAGFYSHLERSGAPVALDEVPPDWEAPWKLWDSPGWRAAAGKG
jgi:predicted dehydrogenase